MKIIFRDRKAYVNTTRCIHDYVTNRLDDVSDDDSLKFYTEYIEKREHKGESEHVYSKLNDDDVNRNKL